ncbi:SIMPL domain-containing protein [Kitasatospora sp. NPDC087315]|uniref:SIMPL domain-containing protein n=1 Tax=Kitasatospora sp. NPDC087315 TaxID=3364069 RepID=UPI003828C91C
MPRNAALFTSNEAGANQVDGVEFEVSTRKELRARARTAAVAAAREKAALYAEAADVRPGPVIHIKDVDSDQLRNSCRGHRQAGGAGGDLAPGKISVAAGVVIGFSITGG